MLRISQRLEIPDEEIGIRQVRASGPGGQKVNKTSAAVHLFFDIRASSLPEPVKEKLLGWSDNRITDEGIVVIKAQEYRSLEKNLEAARERLAILVREATTPVRKRRDTAPSRAAKRARTDSKTLRGRTKSLRGRVDDAG